MRIMSSIMTGMGSERDGYVHIYLSILIFNFKNQILFIFIATKLMLKFSIKSKEIETIVI